MSSVGEGIKAARRKSNLTQAELAEKIGVTAQTISNYEKWKRKLKWETVKRIEEELQMSQLSAKNSREELREVILYGLVESVKITAKSGAWDLPKLTEGAPEEVAKAAMSYAAQAVCAGYPTWFGRCLCALRTILAQDEPRGLACAAALKEAAQRASDEQRVAALTDLMLAVDGVPVGGWAGDAIV